MREVKEPPKMRFKRVVTNKSTCETRVEFSKGQLEHLIAKALGLATTMQTKFDWHIGPRVVTTTILVTKDDQEDDEFHV